MKNFKLIPVLFILLSLLAFVACDNDTTHEKSYKDINPFENAPVQTTNNKFEIESVVPNTNEQYQWCLERFYNAMNAVAKVYGLKIDDDSSLKKKVYDSNPSAIFIYDNDNSYGEFKVAGLEGINPDTNTNDEYLYWGEFKTTNDTNYDYLRLVIQNKITKQILILTKDEESNYVANGVTIEWRN